MYDFPTTPAPGSVVTTPSGSYRVWDGEKWQASPSPQQVSLSAFIDDRPPAAPQPGQLWFDSSNPQLYIFYEDPTGPGQWVIVAAYAGGLTSDAPSNDEVYGRRNGAWTLIAGGGGGAYIGAAPPGDVPAPLWWDNVSGQLFIEYDDGTSTQWVAASTPPDLSGLLPRAGGTMTGPLILAADPTVALGAATKQYADTFLPLTGGSVGGPLVVGGGLTVFSGLTTTGGTVNFGSSGGGSVTTGSNTAATALNLNGGVGSRPLRWQTAGVNRWQWAANGTAEGGSNVGSDLDLSRLTDAGGALGNPVIRIYRASGNIALNTTVVDAGYKLDVNGTTRLNGATTIGLNVGFNNTTPITKPTVTGAKASNAALASLLTALANYGLITDSSTA